MLLCISYVQKVKSDEPWLFLPIFLSEQSCLFCFLLEKKHKYTHLKVQRRKQITFSRKKTSIVLLSHAYNLLLFISLVIAWFIMEEMQCVSASYHTDLKKPMGNIIDNTPTQ